MLARVESSLDRTGKVSFESENPSQKIAINDPELAVDPKNPQARFRAIEMEGIVELPAKAVRGPPPLTPFPEPEKTFIRTTRTSPPGGWSSYFGSSSSTSSSGFLSFIPLFGGQDEADVSSDVTSSSSSSRKKRRR